MQNITITEQELYFTFDGHGSTRVLTDLVGAIAELYAFNAYGNAIGFDPSVALTEFLYSGEQFDAKIGQQYLRARYYDPATGRFNRLDPFFGNHVDPQSFHKYAYVHADPVNFIDPSGLMSIASTLSVSGIQSSISVGLGYVGTAIRFYNTAKTLYNRVHDVINLISYAQLAIGFLNALSISSPQGAAWAIANEVGRIARGNVDFMDILNGFETALCELGPDWDAISNAIKGYSKEISEAVMKEFADDLPKYILLQQRGQLQLVIYLPTGPASYGNRKDNYIPVGKDTLLAVSAGGGRLFGLGVKTSRRGTNFDQFFRIDYWDYRPYAMYPNAMLPPQTTATFRPSITPLHVHYHIGAKEAHNSIWYK
jgi:RHS repeat-associated protein